MVGSLGALEALPLFPAMKPVEITDRPAVESCTHRLPSSADHNFITIWIRNTDERTRLARLGTNLVVEYSNFAKNTVMTFLGDGDIANAAAELLAQTEELHAIPSFVAERLPPERFGIAHDRDQDEYVLDVRRLSALSGRSLRSHRQAANRCARMVGKHLRVEHDPEQLQGGLLELFDRWRANPREERDEGALDERPIVERMVAAWQSLDLTVTALYDGDLLFAADVMELVPDGAIGHCWKADVSYRGSFSLLQRSSAEYLSALGIRELNIEQDLGVEGLRASKLGWRPVRMVRKYRVRARTT